jgi:hypothetical protein
MRLDAVRKKKWEFSNSRTHDTSPPKPARAADIGLLSTTPARKIFCPDPSESLTCS